jgi:large subunit ribosomal protein L23
MEGIILERVVSSEKIVRMIERENLLCFETDRKTKKEEIKKEVEELFGVKVRSVKTLTRKNKKRAYIKLSPEFVAADIATKIGML